MKNDNQMILLIIILMTEIFFRNLKINDIKHDIIKKLIAKLENIDYHLTHCIKYFK